MKTKISFKILTPIFILLLLNSLFSLKAQQRPIQVISPPSPIIKIDPDKISRAPRLKVGYLRLPFRTEIAEVHYMVRNGLAVMEDDILLGTADEVERLSNANKPKFIELQNKLKITPRKTTPNRKNNPMPPNTDVLFSVSTNNANLLWPKGVELLGKVGENLTSKGGTAADHSAKMTFRVDLE